MFRRVEIQLDVSVIITKDNQVMLMQRPQDDHNFPLHWGIPGGGFELTDVSLEETARREVREEVGVEIGPVSLVASNFAASSNVLFVVLRAPYVGGTITIDPKEVLQAGWYGLEDLDGKQFTPTTEALLRDVLR